ncbi:SGNH/GDSL hydrolase family protein [Flavihumibacter sp. R14]|nr:SGNH/GDSL hydrolase family protein [Flavihumibacter soli]
MPLKYLALGDSYTIGEAVAPEQSFPFQAVEKLRTLGIVIDDPQIVAQTGWTTDELMQAIENEDLPGKYDLVSLLIGVNNQYRGYSKGNYRVEFEELLQSALSFADNRSERLYVVSIPDWGVTPFAQQSGRNVSEISADIASFNSINREEALKAGVTYIDITPGSRKAGEDPTLLAQDGLHPSGEMYSQWADLLISAIKSKN